MNILGLVTSTHDAGAAILSEGRIAAIMEEERFNREKHTKAFPRLAIEAALDTAGLSLNDIDEFVMPWDTHTLTRSVRRFMWEGLPQSLNLLRPSANEAQSRRVLYMQRMAQRNLRWHFGKRLNRDIVEVPHHDAHAAAFFVSPFEDAAVLVMDGHGDSGATSSYVGRDNQLELKWQAGFFDSLGAFYTAVTQHIGFRIFEEGTVMALAACGEPRMADAFRQVFVLNDDGGFAIDTDHFCLSTYGLIRPFTAAFLKTLGPPRRPGEPLEDRHRDIAASLQKVTEEVVLHLARGLRAHTQSRNLCISGGVGLNCVANARVLEETDFDRVWVPPCASDTGAPLGATLWHYHQTLGHARVDEMTHALHGKRYSDADVQAALNAAGLDAVRLDDDALIDRVADDLAGGKIVGWFQGRYEIGPRALGNRSILADPRDTAIKETLNARIKFREAFRPFAPAVLAERAGEFFDIDQPDPFMTMAPRVRAEKMDVIPSAVHVDGTARIQTVDEASNPRFHALISAFAERTGVPVLLNTSFNRHEPVVASPADAISCYLRTTMDVLVMNNFYVTDRSAGASRKAEAAFVQTKAHIARINRGWKRQILGV